MNTRKWIPLPVNTDLSEYALHNAEQVIMEYMIKEQLFSDFKYKKLLIASQGMGIAMWLANFAHASVELSPTYEPDEWSLEMVIIKDGEHHSIIVHSDGA